MADFRHKDVDLEFRRGLEELVRGHLDGCLISPSSSACAAEDEEEEEEDDVGPSASTAEETIAPRRRRADPDGEDGLTEPSAVTRRNSRALSRCFARQAEEMITTIERRNRESELMALAGLHTVSTLDSSFLRESRRSPTSQVERPVAARAQSILQMWRELEEMTVPRRERRTAGAPATAVGSRSRDERGDGSSVAASESEYDGYHLSDRNVRMDAPPRAAGDDDSHRLSTEHPPDIGHAERETVPQIARELTTESLIQGPETRISPTIDRENENHNQNQNQRAEWLGETERERVRLVREWVQMTSRQQRDAHAGRTEERDRDTDREGSVTDQEDGQPEHVRRELLRLRGRQARLELIMRMANERQRELEFLSQHRAVSEFSHRNRIQALLRGRFLRNGAPPEDDRERPPSMAVRELGQLRHRHCVSGLREGFRFRLENIVRGQAINSSDSSASQSINISTISQSQETTVTEMLGDNHEQLQSSGQVQSDDDAQLSGEVLNIEQETNTQVVPEPESEIVNVNDDVHESADEMESWQEDDTRQGREEWEPNTEVGFSDWHEVTREEFDTNWQERIEHDWPIEEGDEDGEDDHLPEAHEDWHEYESHHTTETLFEEDHTVETWQEGGGSPENQRSAPTRRVNRFIPPEDENVYSVELRELLSRRSVSNLLHSGFRESLDQLIQSYVQRQGRTPFDWDLERPLLTPDTQNEDQDHQEHDQNQHTQDGVVRPNMFPPPPLPPRQPIWRSGLHHRNWSRQNIRRSEMEWDAINDLRADMARIQEGMTNMQRALEACMDLQLELQRSVRQEVAAALNRSVSNHGLDEEPFHDGSKWSQVRKGTCCICCDNHIDSLLYRCGHMCTCSKCANELVRTGGKCPLCRAPILEVIRAYSIL